MTNDSTSTPPSDSSYYLKYFRIALLNLLIVALLGVVMRYKILAALPWVNQKYLLHGHSHFAFAGWVSLMLMTAFAWALERREVTFNTKPILWMLRLQLLASYGMLFSFPIQGYGPVSITFSTLAIAVSWWHAIYFWTLFSVKTVNKTIFFAARSSLAFNVLSSFGTFFLVYLMVSKTGGRDAYVGAVFTYLHFQYNGWFLFGVITLFLLLQPSISNIWIHRSVTLQAFAAIPGVLLSLLWMPLPSWIYVCAVAAALLQLVALLWLIPGLNAIKPELGGLHKPLWLMAFTALILRSLLQALSVIPALGKYAFAYRPVVIGFLHLMLLGCISLFLLGLLEHTGLLRVTVKRQQTGLLLFVTGFFVTELVLMAQGLLYMGWTVLPHTNELLFGSAVLMAGGIGLLQPGRDIR
jgi:hypothetical protein